MKLNNPLPQPLPKECAKAARIFKSFVDSGNNGLDGVIPRSILENAKGFAIFTVFKAGFLFSARAGSGVVIARLPDGSWSAPSAIGTAGLGVGGQAGAEMTDFLIVLNSRSAIRTFMSAGSLTLGGNLSIAIGPLGRNGEALGSLSTSGKVAAMYSYSKTKGLFGGVSVEGSVIVERQDANSLAYNSHVPVKTLLSGVIPPPDWASPLYETLQACIGLRGNNKWIEDAPSSDTGYAFEGVQNPRGGPSSRLKKKGNKPPFPPETWGQPKASGSYFNSGPDDNLSPWGSNSNVNSQPLKPSWEHLARQDTKSATANFETQFESDFQESNAVRHVSAAPHALTSNNDYLNPFDPPPPFESMRLSNLGTPAKPQSSGYSVSNISSQNPRPTTLPLSPGDSYEGEQDLDGIEHPALSSRAELTQPLPSHGVARAIALFDFNGVEPGDLSFSTGQVIIITEKSPNNDTWWKGQLGGRIGIFPANFVEVV